MRYADSDVFKDTPNLDSGVLVSSPHSKLFSRWFWNAFVAYIYSFLSFYSVYLFTDKDEINSIKTYTRTGTKDDLRMILHCFNP